MGAFQTVGNAAKWLTYHGTTGGLRQLGHSVGMAEEISHLGKLSNKEALIRAPLALGMWPVNAAAHVAGGGIRAAKWTGAKYISAWKNHPILAGVGTLVAAAPIGASMLSAEGNTRSDHRENLKEVDTQQAQTGQVLDVLTRSEAAMPPVSVPQPALTMLEATPQIAAASVASEGRVVGPQATQGVSA